MNIIEIGAHNGGNTSKFYKHAMIWSFEPNPIFANILRDRFQTNENITIIEKAVSDFDGTSTFNIALDGQSSSLYDLSEYSIKNTKIKYVNQIEVEIVRMDTFLNETKIDVIDYFYCDAQGNDLTILKSFGNRLKDIRIGKIEVSIKNELYKDVRNSLAECIQFLNDNGFHIIKADMTNPHDTNLEFYNTSIKSII
jgi:FkbM family methyltransferase